MEKEENYIRSYTLLCRVFTGIK